MVLFVDLDIGSKWDLTMLFKVEILSFHNHVGAAVRLHSSFHRENVQLVHTNHCHVFQHDSGHCLMGQSVIGGMDALTNGVVVLFSSSHLFVCGWTVKCDSQTVFHFIHDGSKFIITFKSSQCEPSAVVYMEDLVQCIVEMLRLSALEWDHCSEFNGLVNAH